MIFCSASGSAVGAAAVGSAGATGASGLGAGGGATGAGNGPGVLRREIGGRTAARFTAPSVSARFGFGFFSSMSETLSTFRGAAFGLAGSAGFGVSAGGAGVFGAGCGSDFGLAGACATAGLETTFAGVCAFAALVSLGASFFFGSA